MLEMFNRFGKRKIVKNDIKTVDCPNWCANEGGCIKKPIIDPFNKRFLGFLVCDIVKNTQECTKVNFFTEYIKKCKRTTGHFKNTGEQISSYSMGLAGETGEIVDYLKKGLFHGHDIDEDKLTEEFGDLFWYIGMLIDIFNLDIEVILEKNIEKLLKRYPEGFKVEDSIKRMNLTCQGLEE